MGIALVLIGSYFGAFRPNDELGKVGKLVKGVMTMFLILGALQVALAVLDQKNPIAASGPAEKKSLVFEKWDKVRFEKALLEKKPIMIDFWADWCEACKELEHKTFPDPKIIELGKKFTLLKFDATKSSPELVELRKTYQIKGLPTLLFFSSSGVWLSKITVTGFENAEEFSKRMEAALK
ncbi:MAG: thioredoxin domain-containing protein [Pseudobdellovibrionaceae bacterium]